MNDLLHSSLSYFMILPPKTFDILAWYFGF